MNFHPHSFSTTHGATSKTLAAILGQLCWNKYITSGCNVAWMYTRYLIWSSVQRDRERDTEKKRGLLHIQLDPNLFCSISLAASAPATFPPLARQVVCQLCASECVVRECDYMVWVRMRARHLMQIDTKAGVGQMRSAAASPEKNTSNSVRASLASRSYC